MRARLYFQISPEKANAAQLSRATRLSNRRFIVDYGEWREDKQSLGWFYAPKGLAPPGHKTSQT